MKLSLFKRVKQHDFPGDVPKSVKIAMREGKRIDEPNRSKTYRKVVNMRTRATIKRNTQKEICVEQYYNLEVKEILREEIIRIVQYECWGACPLYELANYLTDWCLKNNISIKNIIKDAITIIRDENTRNLDYAYYKYNNKLRMVILFTDDEMNFEDEPTY
jgi:hypothetical protein